MSDLQIRPLVPDDSEALRALVETSDVPDAEDRTRRMLWAAFENPHTDGFPSYLVAERGGDLIGYLGRTATRFVVGGQTVSGAYWNDLYVSPVARSQGLGYFVATSLYSALEDTSDQFVAMVWGNETNRQIIDRRGYTRLEGHTYAKVVDGGAYVRARWDGRWIGRLLAPVAAGAVRVAEGWIRLRQRIRLESEEVPRFDDRFEALWRSLDGSLGVSTVRDAAHLNWKWVDRPGADFIKVAVHAGDRLVGWLVLHVDEDGDGRVYDIVCDPDDEGILNAVFLEATRRLRGLGARSAHCVLSDPRFVAAARRHHFVQRDAVPMWVRNLGASGNPDAVQAPEKWHLTLAESDFSLLGA